MVSYTSSNPIISGIRQDPRHISDKEFGQVIKWANDLMKEKYNNSDSIQKAFLELIDYCQLDYEQYLKLTDWVWTAHVSYSDEPFTVRNSAIFKKIVEQVYVTNKSTDLRLVDYTLFHLKHSDNSWYRNGVETNFQYLLEYAPSLPADFLEFIATDFQLYELVLADSNCPAWIIDVGIMQCIIAATGNTSTHSDHPEPLILGLLRNPNLNSDQILTLYNLPMTGTGNRRNVNRSSLVRKHANTPLVILQNELIASHDHKGLMQHPTYRYWWAEKNGLTRDEANALAILPNEWVDEII